MSRSSFPFVAAMTVILQSLAIEDISAQRGTLVQIVTVTATDSLAVEPAPTQIGFITLPPGLAAFGYGRFRVARSGQATAALTVNLVVGGTALAGTDFTSIGPTVVIPPGASFVDIDLVPRRDNVPERDETVVLSAVSGSGYGTVIGAQAVVTILDRDQTIRFTATDNQAAEPAGNNGVIILERLGTLRNDLWVVLQRGGNATNGADYDALPDSIMIPANQTSVSVTIAIRSDGAAEGTESVSLRATNLASTPASGASVSIVDAAVTVAPQSPSLTEAQGNTGNFVLTRTGTATQALTVSYTFGGTATRGTDYTSAANSATFAAGATTAQVPIVVNADPQIEGGETVTLTISGTSTTAAGTPNSASLVINDNVPPVVASLTLSSTAVIGGSTVTATISLNGPAPSGGMPLTISSSNAAASPAQSSVTVVAGQTTASLQVTTVPVTANVGATISATTSGGPAATRVLQVNTPVISGFALNRTSVTPQALVDSVSVTGTLTLSGVAPTNGIVVPLSSSSTSVVVPPNATIPAGQVTATFRVTVPAVSAAVNATVTATRLNTPSTQPLTVQAPTLGSLSATPASLAGRTTPRADVSGTYTLTGPAPNPGVSLAIASNSNRLILDETSIFVAAGSTTGSWTGRAIPVDAATAAIVTATFLGTTRTASVNIVPGAPASMSFNPTPVEGGQSTKGTIQMTGNAPSTGLTIPVSFSPNVVSICGGSTVVTVQPNFITPDFFVCTPVTTGQSTVTVTLGQGSSAISGSFQLAPPILVSSVVLTQTDVLGGTAQFSGTITLASAPVNSMTVTITSSNAAVGLRAGTSGAFNSTLQLTIPGGQTSAGFQGRASTVSSDTQVSISATPGTAQGAIMVRAPSLSVLTVGPATVAGGGTVNGQISLTTGAPPNGFAVQLSSSSPLVTVPSVVTVLAGATSTGFSITTQPMTSDTPVTITATLNGVQRTSTFTVLGPVTVSQLTLNPTSVPAGASGTGTVTLSAAAGSSGATVTLSANDANVTVPPTITVAAGQPSGTFQFQTAVFGGTGNASYQITASSGGVTRTATLAVTPLVISSIVFNPTSVAGGNTVAGSLSLNRAAPAGGITISLSSSNSAVSVPASIIVSGGGPVANFSATTTPVANQITASVTATFQAASSTQSIVVRPPGIQALTLHTAVPQSGVVPGTVLDLTVTLDGQAPAGGAVVNVALSPTGAFTGPATVTVPAGATAVSFQVTTGAVTNTTSGEVRVTRTGITGAGLVFVTVRPPDSQ